MPLPIWNFIVVNSGSNCQWRYNVMALFVFVALHESFDFCNVASIRPYGIFRSTIVSVPEPAASEARREAE